MSGNNYQPFRFASPQPYLAKPTVRIRAPFKYCIRKGKPVYSYLNSPEVFQANPNAVPSETSASAFPHYTANSFRMRAPSYTYPNFWPYVPQTPMIHPQTVPLSLRRNFSVNGPRPSPPSSSVGNVERTVEPSPKSPVRFPNPPPVPSYFGWFLNYGDAEYLSHQARSLVSSLNRDCEISKYLQWSLDDSVWTAKNLHSTAKFCSYGRMPGATEYARNAWTVVGAKEKLTINGIFITPRSIGARVCLNDYQNFWWMGGEEKIPTAPHVTLALCKGQPPVQCGRDLADMLPNLCCDSQFVDSFCVKRDMRGNGCLIEINTSVRTLFKAFP